MRSFMHVCLHISASEESAPHLISILNECVLFPSDASCPPQAPISMMSQARVVSMRRSGHTLGCVCICLKVSFETSKKLRHDEGINKVWEHKP